MDNDNSRHKYKILQGKKKFNVNGHRYFYYKLKKIKNVLRSALDSIFS